MGIHIEWERVGDIPIGAWHRVIEDFQMLQAPHKRVLEERYARRRAATPGVLGMLLPRPPKPAFVILQADDAVLEVGPAKGPRTQGQGPWRIEREGTGNWFSQYVGPHGEHQGEMLLAALILVERHAPGSMRIVQDDYAVECWREATTWMGPVFHDRLQAPMGARESAAADGMGAVQDLPGRRAPG